MVLLLLILGVLSYFRFFTYFGCLAFCFITSIVTSLTCVHDSLIHLYIPQLFVNCLPPPTSVFCVFSVLIIICFIVDIFAACCVIVSLIFCYYLCILLASFSYFILILGVI